MRTRALQRIEQALNAFLTDTCDIEVEEAATDEYGYPTLNWVAVDEDIPCRIIYAGKRNQSAVDQIGMQESMVEIYKLIVPKGTALAVDQRVTLKAGDVFHVVSIIDRLTESVDAQAIITRTRHG